jgi:radical SAM-linked protein
MQRIRISFSKTEEMRYTGHLDLHKTWERVMRRANLPLAYTQGFKPHPRIALACALPLGFTSQAEVVDIVLEETLPLDDIISRLQKAAPPGIQIQGIEEVALNLPALQTVVSATEYEITFLDPLPDLDQSVDRLLSAAELPRQRQGKNYDLRRLLYELRMLQPDASGCQRLYARLAALSGATGRPEELVSALGGDPTAARVHRTRLMFE